MLSHRLRVTDEKSKKKSQDIFFIITMLFVISLYCWKVSKGLVSNDEAFYLSTPYRILKGDGYLSSEWNLAQLSSFLLLIPLKIYLCLFKNADGIYYNFRILYFAFQAINTVFIYLLLRNKGWITIASCIMFALFIPYGIMALNYNSMALSFLILISAIIISDYWNKSVLQIISGILLGCSIMCNPYLVIIYAVFLCITIIKKGEDYYFSFTALLKVTIGCGIIAVAFLVLLLSRSTVSEVIRNLSSILNDPSHETISIVEMIEMLLYYCKPFIVEITAIILCFVISILDNGRYIKKCQIVLQIIIWVLIVHLAVFHSSGYGVQAIGYNAIVAILPVYGLYLIIFKKCRNQSCLIVWGLDMIVALCNMRASNQYLFVVSNALMISSFATLFMQESLTDKMNLYFVLTVSVQLFAVVYVYLTHVYGEGNESLVKINHGPMKNIYADQEYVNQYTIMLSDLDDLGHVEEPVLYYQNIPWAYLYYDNQVGCFSTWGGAIANLEDSILEQYYEYYPEKIPGFIYIDSESLSESRDFYVQYAAKHGYEFHDLPSGAAYLTKEKQ